MSSIVIAGDSSGSVTLQAPAVAGSTVLNLPSTSGTIQTSGAGYTTNGVAYATSTSALATGSALTFDGSNTFLFNASAASSQANFRVQTDTTGAVANGYFNINGTDYFRIYTTSSETGLRNLQNTPMYFSVNNTEQMRLTSTGLGIGTSSPSKKLSITGTGNNETTGSIQVTNTNAGTGVQVGLWASNGTQGAQFSLAGTGFSGYGAYTDGNALVYNNQAITLMAESGSTGIIKFATGGNTERARIDTSGNLLVGSTTNTTNANLILTGATRWAVGTQGGGNLFYIVRDSDGVGQYMVNGSTSWTATSDERLKDIIEPISDAASKVSTLRAVIGKFKKDAEGTRRSFLIAQDVQAVLPEAVTVQEDEFGTLGIQYTEVIPLLVAAIQEQQALINTLTDRISVLENK